MGRFSWIGCAIMAVLISACAQTDAGVTTAVKSKMAADDLVKAYKIDVDTKEHIVTLTGSVDSTAARERAVELARNTQGVGSVIDNLVVSPAPASTTGIETTTDGLDRAGGATRDAARDAGAVVSDAAITSAVKTKFLADPAVAGLKIDVDTKDGVVTLSGILPASSERQRAVVLARETSGVKAVVDQIKVK
jgi:osmotically-inducible protein OsmY